MLVGIEGGLGTGKTIQLVRYLAKDSHAGHDIYANFGLNKIKYNPIDIKELLEFEKENINFTNATIGIDEITVFVDCRTSSSRSNRIFSYFVLQSRKRNVNVYYTTQSCSMLDKRLVEHTHIIILCDFHYQEVVDENDVIHKIPMDNWRHYTILDFRNPRDIKRTAFSMDITKFYPYYDTDEIIQPLL